MQNAKTKAIAFITPRFPDTSPLHVRVMFLQ